MLYEILKMVVAISGPLVIYLTVTSMVQSPELIMALPAVVRRGIQAIGAAFIVGAWLVTGTLSGAMALVGLLLLITPPVARKLSESNAAYLEVWS
ncbi:MAG: hypothetical protein FOGNACKC_03084 [Anaerolineae bacterium]|nr:hypothetical protein [Anaerolineae bacterium]